MPSADQVATFRQAAPRPLDLFQADAALQDELKHRVPEALRSRVAAAWSRMGALSAGPLWTLMQQAEARPPVLQPYDAWGRRIDAIHLAPGWEALHALAAEEGLVATGYDADLGPWARLCQAGLIHLYSASSAIASCPMAMTDACARVLLDQGPTDLQERWLPRLLSRDPASFVTSGQWMTERPGGSDVGMSETIAIPEGGDTDYRLYGVKWFTSAATSALALTLARVDEGQGAVPGSKGLTMFLVEVTRDEQGALQGIELRRLKDKLGTRALPTAELALEGARARRIGAVGRGVPNISTMLNITRYWNACSSSSAMAQAALWARDYAGQRVAFGRPLSQQPLHQRTLAEMEAEAAGALALVLELATLLGRVEVGQGSSRDLALLRGLLPVAKALTGKQAVAVTSEALEAFGGAGYMEDTGLPRMLRDAQTLPIWEGTTNVLSLDLLRAEGKDGSLRVLVEEIGRRLAALPEGVDGEARAVVSSTLTALGRRLGELAKDGDRARLEAEARRVALTTGLLFEAVLLGETAAMGPAAAARFATFVRAKLMGPLG